jgi:16S rRNA A1518/A1519 N6-dimethyltransferase RsmA/KsgA/DIM1 with predicted DNA glycosylase/AP lyase activity
MGDIVLLVVLVVVLSFGFVVLFGAPYVPTMKRQVDAAFDLLELSPGQHLLELGCGDGIVLLAAAKRGIRVTGYELNPLLVVVCWLRTRRYRKLVSVRMADFWRADWPKADAVFGFILPKLMPKLDSKIVSENRGPLKVVSFAFEIPAKKIIKQQDGVFLYHYK